MNKNILKRIAGVVPAKKKVPAKPAQPGKKKPAGKKSGLAKPKTPRQKLGGAIADGVRALMVPKELIVKILALTSDQVMEVSAKLKAALKDAGLTGLTDDERVVKGQEIQQVMLAVARDVAKALGKCPQVVTKLETTPAQILEPYQQYVELVGIAKFLDEVSQRVGEAQGVLEAFQAQMRASIASAIYADLTGVELTQAQKDQLLIDAAEVLDKEEHELAAALAVRKKNAVAVGDAKAVADEEETAALVLQTMRDIREGKAIQPGQQQELALHYADIQAATASSVAAAATAAVSPAARSPGRRANSRLH